MEGRTLYARPIIHLALPVASKIHHSHGKVVSPLLIASKYSFQHGKEGGNHLYVCALSSWAPLGPGCPSPSSLPLLLHAVRVLAVLLHIAMWNGHNVGVGMVLRWLMCGYVEMRDATHCVFVYSNQNINK